MIDLDKYRKCVGIMMLNNQGKVFVGQRFDSSIEAWQMPQGGIDAGETPEQAMQREIMEEVGTDKFEIIHKSDEWLYYDLPIELQKVLWNGKYLGQMQKWFLLRFTGTDEDINIATEIPEFKDWQWVEPQQIIELIVDFKKDLYADILRKFEDKI